MKIKLILGNIKKNIIKALIVLACIALAYMTIFVMINVYYSFQKMNLEKAYNSYGKYNILLSGVTEEEIEKIENRWKNNIEIGKERIISRNDNIFTVVPDDNAYVMNCYSLSMGEYPENEDEIAVSATAVIDGKYLIYSHNVGDEIKLDGKRYILKGILDNYNYSTDENLSVAVTGEKDNDSEKSVEDEYNLYIHIKNAEDIQAVYEKLYEDIKSELGIPEEEICKTDIQDGLLSGCKMILNDELNIIEIEGQNIVQDDEIKNMLITAIIVICANSVIFVIYTYKVYLRKRRHQKKILLNLGYSEAETIIIYGVESFILFVLGTFIGIIMGRVVTEGIIGYINSVQRIKIDSFKVVYEMKSYIVAVLINVIGVILGYYFTFNSKEHNLKEKSSESSLKNRTNYTKKLLKRKKSVIIEEYYSKNETKTEKILAGISLLLIGIITVVFVQLNKYVEYQVESEEKYSAQFHLLTSDASEMEELKNNLSNIDFFSVALEIITTFNVDKKYINEKYMQEISYSEDGKAYISVDGIDETEYYKRIKLSETVSYEEFVKSGKAIIIDNIGTTDENCIFNELPEYLEYDGIDEVINEKKDKKIKFNDGKIGILARSTYKGSQESEAEGGHAGVNLLVPEKLFKEKFDYSIALISINAKEGDEAETAEKLNKLSNVYKYRVNDNSSEYIKQEDKNKIIVTCFKCVLVYVVLINLIGIIYINILFFNQRKDDFKIMKNIGCSLQEVFIPFLANKMTCTFVIIVSGCIAEIIFIKIYYQIRHQELFYQTVQRM